MAQNASVGSSDVCPFSMPPPSDHPAFRLCLLAPPFEVKQVKPSEPVPAEFLHALTDASSGKFVSVTRTDEEVSIVYETEDTSATWRCMKIAGPMDFGWPFLLLSVLGLRY